MRPAVWLSYVTGGLLILPAAALMFLPDITGDWSSNNMTWEIGAGGGLGLALDLALLHGLVGLRL